MRIGLHTPFAASRDRTPLATMAERASGMHFLPAGMGEPAIRFTLMDTSGAKIGVGDRPRFETSSRGSERFVGHRQLFGARPGSAAAPRMSETGEAGPNTSHPRCAIATRAYPRSFPFASVALHFLHTRIWRQA